MTANGAKKIILSPFIPRLPVHEPINANNVTQSLKSQSLTHFHPTGPFREIFCLQYCTLATWQQKADRWAQSSLLYLPSVLLLGLQENASLRNQSSRFLLPIHTLTHFDLGLDCIPSPRIHFSFDYWPAFALLFNVMAPPQIRLWQCSRPKGLWTVIRPSISGEGTCTHQRLSSASKYETTQCTIMIFSLPST